MTFPNATVSGLSSEISGKSAAFVEIREVRIGHVQDVSRAIWRISMDCSQMVPKESTPEMLKQVSSLL
jgi:hypothetical protein